MLPMATKPPAVVTLKVELLYVKPLKVIDCVAVVGVVGGMQGAAPKQALLKPTKFVSTAPAAAGYNAVVAPTASVSA